MDKTALLIFDLDGTLINAYTPVYRSLNHTLKKYGCKPVSHTTAKRSVGWGDRNLLKRFVPPAELDAALKDFRKHHQKSLGTGVRFMPGAKRLLTVLKKQGVKLAVASNRSTASSRIILKNLGIDRHFRYILCGDKLKNLKPHPEILLRILKRLKMKPAAAVYVGDMALDVQAGRKAGVRTVAVAAGSSTAAEIKRQKPWRTVRKVDGVLDILRRIKS